jgi:hypothetical protein
MIDEIGDIFDSITKRRYEDGHEVQSEA